MWLDPVLKRCGELWRTSFEVAETRTIVGELPWAGTPRPLPSSMARVSWGDGASFWLPAPLPEDNGPAPLLLHGGHVHVMPVVRLLVDSGEVDSPRQPSSFDIQFRTFGHWLDDACTRWRFSAYGPPGLWSPLDWLREQKVPAEIGIRHFARLIRYALFGSDQPWSFWGLRMPACPMWLRPVEGTSFMKHAAQHLVITARLAGAKRGTQIPSTDLRSSRYRMQPTLGDDWGLDPVHTPEGGDIRLTGRLGLGVTIDARGKLVVPHSARTAPLSVSAARLPFAGYNDPRRLLMAANMQLHAVPVCAPETPLVRRSPDAEEPPGVNLRIGYLAWQGWNHEDAWVLSRSAAAKLSTTVEKIQTIGIRAVEMAAKVLVKVGDSVARGQLLVQRRAAPLLMTTALPVLARNLAHEDSVVIESRPEDHADIPGTVTSVDVVDLLAGHEDVSPELTSTYRALIRITLQRELPLEVGDKLANRHGHKGIVGAILPDDEMPRWRGQPLEALIDPVSVLNRSNWGQVLETLAGAVAWIEGVPCVLDDDVNPLAAAQKHGADAHGRWIVEIAGDSLHAGDRSPLTPRPSPLAVAGLQFVMRLPHHAADKMSGSPVPRGERDLRRREQRLGEMDQWALWAHDVLEPARDQATLAPAAQKLARLLAAAGYELKLEGVCIRLRRLPLDQTIPAAMLALPYSEGTLGEVFDCLEEVGTEPAQAVAFDPPVQGVKVIGHPNGIAVAWLPIVPAKERKPRRLFSGLEEIHPLTQGLRRVLRAARQRSTLNEEPGASADREADLRDAIAELMDEAYALAVGVRATGIGSSKLSFLSRQVMGARQTRSARATISPGGPLALRLDEVGIPPPLARCLFGDGLPHDIDKLAEAVNGREVWLKRDPVLHRWGFLPVRVRVVPGSTIRMPASLLGPLGADFDGDTVALFSRLPWPCRSWTHCRPACLAWHPQMERAMLLPGKQYLFGLYVLQRHAGRLAALQDALTEAGAPRWPQEKSAATALKAWVRLASLERQRPEGWAIVEQHALAALAEDPGMGFGLVDVAELANLPVVCEGAAKNLVDHPRARAMMQAILEGRCLEIYRRGQAEEPDPIAQVMVAAKAAIGRFGGALRRLLFAAQSTLSAKVVQDAQTLTEQVTQQALSVKAGKPPLEYHEYEQQLRRLLKGQAWSPDAGEQLLAILQPLEKAWQRLAANMAPGPPAWLTWLRQPFNLADIVTQHGAIDIPIGDCRARAWTEARREFSSSPPAPQ